MNCMRWFKDSNVSFAIIIVDIRGIKLPSNAMHPSSSAISFHEIHLSLFKPMLNSLSLSPFHHSPLPFLRSAITHLPLSGKNAYLKLLLAGPMGMGTIVLGGPDARSEVA